MTRGDQSPLDYSRIGMDSESSRPHLENQRSMGNPVNENQIKHSQPGDRNQPQPLHDLVKEFSSPSTPSLGACKLSWRDILAAERTKEYFQQILSFIEGERRAGKVIYPQNEDVFNALKWTELSDVKVVIIGQDPYHGPGQAHGLCFSVKPHVALPPSLKNIFKELTSDLGIPSPINNPPNGSLEKWARQGVLLLNTVLTVEQGRPESHAKIGWQRFTDLVIKAVNDHRSGVVFLLWGAHAQKKVELIDLTKHHIIKSAHPSPLSAARGFLGSRPFSKTNQLLASPINWT